MALLQSPKVDISYIYALAHLEVNLGPTWSQHGPNMAKTWPQKVVIAYICAVDHDDLICRILEI